MKIFKVKEHSKQIRFFTIEAETQEQAEEMVLNDCLSCDDVEYNSTYFDTKEINEENIELTYNEEHKESEEECTTNLMK